MKPTAIRNLLVGLLVAHLAIAAGWCVHSIHKRRERAIALHCIINMQFIEGAKAEVQSELKLSDGAVVSEDQLLPVLGRGAGPEFARKVILHCEPAGGRKYELGKIEESVSCPYHGTIYEAAARWEDH